MRTETWTPLEGDRVLYTRIFPLFPEWVTVELIVTNRFLEITEPDKLEFYLNYCVRDLMKRHGIGTTLTKVDL